MKSALQPIKNGLQSRRPNDKLNAGEPATKMGNVVAAWSTWGKVLRTPTLGSLTAFKMSPSRPGTLPERMRGDQPARPTSNSPFTPGSVIGAADGIAPQIGRAHV